MAQQIGIRKVVCKGCEGARVDLIEIIVAQLGGEFLQSREEVCNRYGFASTPCQGIVKLEPWDIIVLFFLRSSGRSGISRPRGHSLIGWSRAWIHLELGSLQITVERLRAERDVWISAESVSSGLVFVLAPSIAWVVRSVRITDRNEFGALVMNELINCGEVVTRLQTRPALDLPGPLRSGFYQERNIHHHSPSAQVQLIKKVIAVILLPLMKTYKSLR